MYLVMFIPGLVGIAFLISALVRGRAITPLRGTLPMIVRREVQPSLYWWSIAMHVLIIACSLWIPVSGLREAS